MVHNPDVSVAGEGKDGQSLPSPFHPNLTSSHRTIAACTSSPCSYLKVVDRHNEQMVSAYLTPGGTRFMLLHDARNEEGIKAFFLELHELFIKQMLNPFYVPNSAISSKDFDARARAAARKFLGYRGE